MATRRRVRAKPDGGLVPVILRLCLMRRLRAWRCNSGTVLLASGHRIALSPAGTPDVLLVLPPYGQLAGIEAKALDGKQNPDQRKWQTEMESVGVRYAVVRSAREVIQLLDQWIRETQ